MHESAQDLLDRRIREFTPAIHEHARMEGLLPPYRFHMISVDHDQFERAGHPVMAGGIARAAFRECCEKLGVVNAVRVDIPDYGARLHWIAAVTGQRKPQTLAGRMLRGLGFGRAADA